MIQTILYVIIGFILLAILMHVWVNIAFMLSTDKNLIEGPLKYRLLLEEFDKKGNLKYKHRLEQSNYYIPLYTIMLFYKIFATKAYIEGIRSEYRIIRVHKLN